MTGDLLRTAWNAVAMLAAILTLAGSLELLVLSLAALYPARRSRSNPDRSPWSVGVVVPAHNEALSVASCVHSLVRAEKGDMQVDIFVIADNCTDGTASIAAAAGAQVLERVDPSQRGKGYALNFAFTHERLAGCDCVLIVDADTEVAENFITAAAGAMRDGEAAVQSRYLVRNVDDSVRTRLMGLALRAFNVVRPLGREHLGLSAGILGNGFGLTRETLCAVPYLASSVVEDLEYHLSLVRSGRRVAFLNETTVCGEMPVKGPAVDTQRSRWEGGRLRMLVEHSPKLLLDVLSGKLRCAEPLLELLLLPLAFHATLLLVAVLAPLPLVRDIGLAGLAIVALHLLAAILVGGGSWRDVGTLAFAPLYIAWKLIMIPSLVRNARSSHAWVRTGRKSEQFAPVNTPNEETGHQR
ncbi:MAG TPA: glycosyltransferase family 2 protein [Edaphobacter sp.]